MYNWIHMLIFSDGNVTDTQQRSTKCISCNVFHLLHFFLDDSFILEALENRSVFQLIQCHLRCVFISSSLCFPQCCCLFMLNSSMFGRVHIFHFLSFVFVVLLFLPREFSSKPPAPPPLPTVATSLLGAERYWSPPWFLPPLCLPNFISQFLACLLFESWHIAALIKCMATSYLTLLHPNPPDTGRTNTLVQRWRNWGEHF